ncbi:MAG: hypothetical protein ABIN18_04050 [Pseudomonadota bacterium]
MTKTSLDKRRSAAVRAENPSESIKPAGSVCLVRLNALKVRSGWKSLIFYARKTVCLRTIHFLITRSVLKDEEIWGERINQHGLKRSKRSR